MPKNLETTLLAYDPMSVSLVTGVSGQIGSYLVEQLAKTEKVIGICRNVAISAPVLDNVETVCCDICSYDDVYRLFCKYKPKRIFHLATYHFRAGPWNAPQDVMNTNVIGTINVLEAVKAIRSEDADYAPVVVITGSAMCYGDSLKDVSEPITESLPLRPTTPYALSKMAQEMLAEQYFNAYGIKTIRTRVFAVTSPKADHGSVFDFTRKTVLIENGMHPNKLEVGDINVFRSIIHARDVSSALVLLSESTAFGEVFNVCGEEYYSIADVLKKVRSKSNVPYDVIIQNNLFQTSERFLVGNPSKLMRAVGWKPEFSLDMIIDEMLGHFRNFPATHHKIEPSDR